MLFIPSIVSWSPKGKQLAIALQSGDIVTFSPSEIQQAKSFITRPSSLQGQTIIHTTWLSNPTFYAVFVPFGPLDPHVDQKHVVIVHDAKRPDASADVAIPINFFPSGVRPPGAFTIALKGWDPAKILLLVGDSTTSDIGLACCTADDKWQKLSFDEGAPSMPLDADQNETTMIGFELDLKNTTPYDVTTSTGETVSVPPPPVVWAYASDGTVIAWYVVNTRGTQYPGMAPASALSPVLAPAAPSVPSTSPFSQVAQPTFVQPSQPTFGQPSQPGAAFGSAGSTGPTFGQPGFGQTSTPGSAFGQPTFGSPSFGQTATASTYGQTSPPGQASSGGGFASFADAPIKWGQASFGSTLSGFGSGAPPAPPPQIQPAESTESMATDTSQELSLGGMSLGGDGNGTQPKGGLGMTSMFGAPTPAAQPAASQATTAFGGSSFLSPGVGAFAKFVTKQTDETPSTSAVEAPKPSAAFGQTGLITPSFGQSGFGQPSFGQSGFGKAGPGTPMSTTPIVTPISTTSPSTFGGGGGFSAFASGGLATLSSAKPAEAKQGTPATSGGGGFGAFASGGPSAFSQAASNKSDSVPAWKTGGDATFGSGAGSAVFGGTTSASPVAQTTTPVKSPFAPARPAASTTPSTSPVLTAASPEKAASSFASTTPSASPFTVTPSKSQSPTSPNSTPPTSPPIAASSAKSAAPPAASTTPAGPPPVPNAFMGLKMSTGFGLSNFSAKDSPFANPKPIPQTVNAFGGGQSSAPKVPTPATPGSVFGQTSSFGAAAKGVSAFGRPAFGSPSTPSTTPSTTPSSSQTASGGAFSAFSGSASAFGKTAGSGMSFSDMLRKGGSSPDSAKLKESPTTPRSALASALTTPRSAFDKSPTPQPAKALAAQDGEDEEGEEKDEGREGQAVSAASSFSNLSLSTSSFVSIPSGGEEEEEEEGLTPPAPDGDDGEQGEQQIDGFLSDSYSEGEEDEEEQEAEPPEGESEEEGEDQEQVEGESEDEENKVPPPAEIDPTAIPLPDSRSPSSTPKAEGPSINVEPTPLPAPQPKASSFPRAQSTTPPGSPSKDSLSLQTPLEQPTPIFPLPSLSPSPASGAGPGRSSTRPLRSSPLANAPVSGGDEEDVKGEKPPSLKPRPASPKPPFGQWDSVAKPPSPSPSEEKSTSPAPQVEPLIDQSNKPTSSVVPRPKTPPPFITKGVPLNDKPSSSSATAAPTVAAPVPMLNLSGFSLGAPVKPETKPAVDESTKPAIPTAPSAFGGIKPGVFSLTPKPESSTETPSAPDTKPLVGTLFGSKPSVALAGTPKMPLAPTAGLSLDGPFAATPGAVTPPTTAASTNNVLGTPSRMPGTPSLLTPPKDSHPMQVEFTNLITELSKELATVC